MSLNRKQKTLTEIEINLKSSNIDLKPFPHPFYEGDYSLGCQPKTLAELTMMRLSGAIRTKSKWYDKMKDQTIRSKWKEEALQQTSLSDKKIDYVLDELQYYDSIRDGPIQMSAVDGVWQSDELIPIHLKEGLIKYVKNLEDIPENKKDWHPGTNQQNIRLSSSIIILLC